MVGVEVVEVEGGEKVSGGGWEMGLKFVTTISTRVGGEDS